MKCVLLINSNLMIALKIKNFSPNLSHRNFKKLTKHKQMTVILIFIEENSDNKIIKNPLPFKSTFKNV